MVHNRSTIGISLAQGGRSEIEGSLRKRIAAGEWAPTGRLPPERELAAEYGVARNTVRRAVEAIAHEGTVERHVGRGTFVNGGAIELATLCSG